MFTGLVQDVGTIKEISKTNDYSKITVATTLAKELSIGDSISVNGVCLTAVALNDNDFVADVMVQTLKLSNLGELQLSSPVNLELATKVDARLGGHIVQGHVDGVGEVLATNPGEKWLEFIISVPETLKRYIVNQGSICIDGVSLTVGEIDDSKNQVTVWLIPETLAKTTLGQKKKGDRVNLEVDVLAKYVERLINAQSRAQSNADKGEEKR